jgi:hypothetical protein
MESEAFGVSKGPIGSNTHSSKMTYKRPVLSPTAWSGVPVVFVCGLCVLSLTATGYFSYRETVLESRLGALEAQFAVVRATLGGGPSGDVVLERLRREVETQMQHRMNRQTANGRRLLMDAMVGATVQLPQHTRAPRDVSECVCPPGRMTDSLTHMS